ncbi:hypothetical protein E2C01_093154 [Portunus trituberculatus]|uniref:Uncharacterized protein n=1 Tax=Portunus trituberculatus TaxID=210409 RepID=A0A5B7JSJ1_PORTR|nr:hypothetical protein [Portunus trituberculatus]
MRKRKGRRKKEGDTGGGREITRRPPIDSHPFYSPLTLLRVLPGEEAWYVTYISGAPGHASAHGLPQGHAAGTGDGKEKEEQEDYDNYGRKKE